MGQIASSSRQTVSDERSGLRQRVCDLDSHLVESSRLLPLALAKDISTGKLAWSGHYLVDPWNCDGLVDLKKFPRLRAYFEEHAAALKRRHSASNNATGWYKRIDRVKHSLTTRPKLFIAGIKRDSHPGF